MIDLCFSSHRLIFFSNPVSYGGGERYLLVTLTWLKAHGFNVRLVTSNKIILQDLEEFFLDEHLVEKDDIILLNGNGALYKWGRCFDNVKIFIMHSLISDRQDSILRYLARPFIMMFYLRFVSAVVKVTESCCPNFFHRKVFTIQNGVDVSSFALNGEKKSDTTVLKCVMIGAVNKNKNQELAIDALKNIDGVELTIVGDGPEKEMLEKRADLAGLSQRVRFVGFQKNIKPYLYDADLCLMLSKYEAFPFVVLESMSCGTPVLANMVGGVPDVIKHNFDGFIIKSLNACSLVNALSFLKDHKSSLSMIGGEARRKIENEFTLELMVKGLLRVIKKVCDEKD